MRIVIAPDKFKGCLSAAHAACAIAEGVRRRRPDAEIDLCPQADGGEGFVEAMLGAMPGRLHHTRVVGPRPDQTVVAAWGLLEDGPTAVIEMSAASGLALLPQSQRDPMRTTTHGTGQLLLAAYAAGARRILLGIGGSATIDAGLGCCNAVGHTVLLDDGEPAVTTEPLAGGDLERVRLIKRGRGSPLDRVPIEVACDVTNPLLGPEGAAFVYGPQKGATDDQVIYFERQHRRLAEACFKLEEAWTPGAGAAGGLGWAMISFFTARLVRGIELVASATRLAGRLEHADLCITGEGCFDRQSFSGKTAAGVAEVCRRLGVPCLLVAGRIEADPTDWFAAAEQATPAEMPLPQALRDAPRLIADSAERLMAAYAGPSAI